MAISSGSTIERRKALFARSWTIDGTGRGHLTKARKRVPYTAIPLHSEIQQIIEIARSAGYHLQPILVDKFLPGRGFSQKFLLANGRLSIVVCSRTEVYPSRANLNGYSQAHFLIEKLRKYSLAFVLQNVPSFEKKVFVIPTNDILKICREDWDISLITIMILTTTLRGEVCKKNW